VTPHKVVCPSCFVEGKVHASLSECIVALRGRLVFERRERIEAQAKAQVATAARRSMRGLTVPGLKHQLVQERKRIDALEQQVSQVAQRCSFLMKELPK
jgi:small-conductance mechanosensitive channel